MINNLKQVTCDQTCGFMIIGRDSRELSRLFVRHAKINHDTSLTLSEVSKKIQTAIRLPKQVVH